MHYFSFSGSFQLDPTEPAALHYTYSNFINIRYLAVNPVRHIRYTYSKLACIFWPHPVGGGLCLVLWGHGHYHRPTCSTRPSQGSPREQNNGQPATKDGLKKQCGEYGIIYSGSGYNFLEFQILILPTHVI